MGRTRKSEQVSNREQQSALDFNELPLVQDNEVTDDTEILIRNSPHKESKTTLGVVLEPYATNERVDVIEEEVERLEAVKADKCFTIAMSIALG